MAFNSIDLQMSLPRTPDSSAQQSHEANKPVLHQSLLENGASKQTESMRGRSSAVEQSGMKGVKDEQRKENGKSANRQHREGNEDDKPERGKEAPPDPAGRHPFKGRHIDITL